MYGIRNGNRKISLEEKLGRIGQSHIRENIATARRYGFTRVVLRF